MKKLSLIVPLLFIGCGTFTKTSTPRQPSIQTQKMDAQSAWDELEGKKVSMPTPTTRKTTSTQKAPNITNEVQSMLEKGDTIPDWFYSPPKSDKYFYGAGEGSSVERAKVSALNLIAGEIQTAVSSSFSKREGYSNINGKKDFYKSVRSNTRSEVKKITFTNIEVMKTIKVNGKIYLLVRINKQQLFKTLKNRFELLDNKITSQIEASRKYSLLDQLITLNKAQKQIQKALSLANILATLNPDFELTKYANRYNSYINQKTELLHQITLSVAGNDLFAQKLVEILNQQGYKIAQNSDVTIKLQKQLRTTKPYQMVVVRGTVNIQVVAKNKTLKSTSIEVKGISNEKSEAIAKASINFKNKLQKIGINKLLGLE